MNTISKSTRLMAAALAVAGGFALTALPADAHRSDVSLASAASSYLAQQTTDTMWPVDRDIRNPYAGE